jgi:hypothetical protein
LRQPAGSFATHGSAIAIAKRHPEGVVIETWPEPPPRSVRPSPSESRSRVAGAGLKRKRKPQASPTLATVA